MTEHTNDAACQCGLKLRLGYTCCLGSEALAAHRLGALPRPHKKKRTRVPLVFLNSTGYCLVIMHRLADGDQLQLLLIIN